MRDMMRDMSRDKPWTREEELILLEMWPTHKAKTIADRLGRTRLSVIGKADRLRWRNEITILKPTRKGQGPTMVKRAARKRDDAVARSQVRRIVAKAKRGKPMEKPMLVPMICEPLPSLDIPLLEIHDGQCHHIQGEPVANAPMCGHPTEIGHSFCPSHRLILESPRG